MVFFFFLFVDNDSEIISDLVGAVERFLYCTDLFDSHCSFLNNREKFRKKPLGKQENRRKWFR